MKSKTEATNEYTNFRDALGKVLKVSHSEMQQRIQQEKEQKPPAKRASSSGRASECKD